MKTDGAPSWKCESAFSILSQIRHRFHVAIVLFHDGIVAAAAPITHRLFDGQISISLSAITFITRVFLE